MLMPYIGGYKFYQDFAIWTNPKDALYKLNAQSHGPVRIDENDYFADLYRDDGEYRFQLLGGRAKGTDSMVKDKFKTPKEIYNAYDEKNPKTVIIKPADYKGYDGLKFIKQFDTGGYTGKWGPDGRLAMLHQKEIVLNAHDTENLLSIVDMVRQMANSLDLNALAMTAGLANLIATTNVVSTGQQLDQNVTITAEFPNAINKEEIQAAFGDLVNLAAQYANRK